MQSTLISRPKGRRGTAPERLYEKARGAGLVDWLASGGALTAIALAATPIPRGGLV